MTDFQVPDKSLLTSIDRSADSFLIYDASASALKRTNANYLNDLTSHPVGIDDVQTLTNKTLTAPTISSPALSGTLTGTYTLGGTPTFPAAVVTLTGSQTLTNKVLTSPTINSATISNPTLTTDSVNEFTSANGVTVDGLNIKDGKLNTANSVVATNITSGILTNAMLSTTTGELGGAWQTWTPTWTNLTVGNGTVTANYQQVGKTTNAYIKIVFGTTTSVSGFVRVSLPVTALSRYTSNEQIVNGNVTLNDNGTSTYVGYARFVSTTAIEIGAINVASTYAVESSTSSTVPFTWTTGDGIILGFSYEAA